MKQTAVFSLFSVLRQENSLHRSPSSPGLARCYYPMLVEEQNDGQLIGQQTAVYFWSHFLDVFMGFVKEFL